MTGEETDLREALHRLAGATAPPPRADLADVVLRRHRARRRQQAALAAVAALVAGVVVLAPGLLRGSGSGSVATPAAGVEEPATATDTPTAVDTPAPAVHSVPTRGSLAGDAAFVEAVRQLPWTSPDVTGGLPDPAPAQRHVVFAGDVPGGRWALVAGAGAAAPAVEAPERRSGAGPRGDVAVAWFVGPPGAAPEQLRLSGVPHDVAPGTASALSDATTGALVVVAAPGDAISVSLRPEVAADGAVTRAWEPVAAPDGVAVLDVGRRDAVYDQALRYRVTRAGQSEVQRPDTYADPATTPPRVDLGQLREPPAPSPVDELVTRQVQAVLARTGLAADEVGFAVLWAGDVPAAGDRTGRVTLLAATLPSGAVYVSALAAADLGDGSLGGTTCGSALLPRGTDLAGTTVAVRCDLPSADAFPVGPGTLVVVGPDRAVSAHLGATDGDDLGEVALADGVGQVPAPERVAQVETRDAAGTPVARVGLLGSTDLDG